MSTSIPTALLSIFEEIGQQYKLPRVRELVLGPVSLDNASNCKFAAMTLEDNTVGLTYVALDNAAVDLHRLQIAETLPGTDPIALCKHYGEKSGWRRSLGMAAINAVSHWLFRKSGTALTGADKTRDALQFLPTDHIGMVGFFKPLVKQIRDANVPLTVIELDASLQTNEPGFEVTIETASLRECSKVIVTGTTLINHSIDNILDHCSSDAEVHIIGPSTGCLPDPIFDRGVNSIGGRVVTDVDTFVQQWRHEQSWNESTRRYTISRDSYAGWRSLL